MIKSPDFNRAATMAYRCLIARGVTSSVVDPLAMIKACRNTQVTTFQAWQYKMDPYDYFMLTSWQDGFTQRQDMPDGTTRYLVAYNAQRMIERRRFTLAHELGHIVLKHQEEGPAEEMEANHFAMHLLCPRPAVHAIAVKFSDQLRDAHFYKAFGISRACARQIPNTRPCSVPTSVLAAVPRSITDDAVDRASLGRITIKDSALSWRALYHY